MKKPSSSEPPGESHTYNIHISNSNIGGIGAGPGVHVTGVVHPAATAASDTPSGATGSATTSATSETAVSSSSDSRVDFAILTAIEVERRAVCAAFGLKDEHRVHKGSRVYWRGRLPLRDGAFYEIVVGQPSDMGNIEAALLAADVVRDWRPAAALLVGIAASTDKDVKLGDIVVSRTVYYYEHGKVTPEGTRPQPEMIPADALLLNKITAISDWDGIVAIARPDGSDDRPRIHRDVIASGEKVIAYAAVRDEIAAGHRRIRAVEMEGWGFSKAIWQAHERVRHIDIRGICDDGSSAKDDRWHAYAAAAAASVTRQFLADRPIEPMSRSLLPEVSPRAPFHDPPFLGAERHRRTSTSSATDEPLPDQPSLRWLIVAMTCFAMLLAALHVAHRYLPSSPATDVCLVTLPILSVVVLTLLFARRHESLRQVPPEEMADDAGHFVTLYYGGNSARGTIFSNVGALTSMTLFFCTIAPIGYLHPVWATLPLFCCMTLALWVMPKLGDRAPSGTWTTDPLADRGTGLAHFFARICGSRSASVVHKFTCAQMLVYAILEVYLLMRIGQTIARAHRFEHLPLVYVTIAIILILPLIYVLARGYTAVLKTDGIQLGIVVVCGCMLIALIAGTAKIPLQPELIRGTDPGGASSMAINLILWSLFSLAWFATLPDFWIRNVATLKEPMRRGVRVATIVGMFIVSAIAFVLGKLVAILDGGTDFINANFNMAQRLDRSQSVVLRLVEWAADKPLPAACLLCLCVGAAMSTIDTHLLTIAQIGWNSPSRTAPQSFVGYDRRRVLPAAVATIIGALVLVYVDEWQHRLTGRSVTAFEAVCVAFPGLSSIFLLFVICAPTHRGRVLSSLTYGNPDVPTKGTTRDRRLARQLAVYLAAFPGSACLTGAVLNWDFSGHGFWILGGGSLILTLTVGYLVGQVVHAVLR